LANWQEILKNLVFSMVSALPIFLKKLADCQKNWQKVGSIKKL
jgi:hypothetical protein